MQAGLDSLAAVELRSAIATRLSIHLPATVTFDYPTAAALTSFVVAQQHTVEVFHTDIPHSPSWGLTVPVHHADGGIAIVGMSCAYPGAETSGKVHCSPDEVVMW